MKANPRPGNELPLKQTVKIARNRVSQLRTMREKLGLTLAEIGRQVSATPPAIRAFELAETEDRITLGSLRRVAGAMSCDLVYSLIPRDKAKAPQVEEVTPKAPAPHSPSVNVVIDDWRKSEGMN